jgi:hypothetical protein
MEPFHIFLKNPYPRQVNPLINIITNSEDLYNFSRLHLLYFSVGHILMLANVFKKKWKVLTTWKVRGFYSNH